MKTALVKLKSVSPYSQSRRHETPKASETERPDDYVERTWKEYTHTTPDGEVFIPPMAFKNGLVETAKYLGKTVPGKGKKTYTKFFEGSVMIMEPVKIGMKKDDLQPERLFLPSDGRRGSGSRVKKIYPLIAKWEGELEIIVTDDTITQNVLREHLEAFGKYIGIGRFRPANNGYYGRFEVVEVVWN